MKSIYQSILGLFILTIFSCTKGHDSTVNGGNGASTCILSSSYCLGKWQFEKIEMKENGVFRDITSQFELCDRDDYFLFKSDGTYSRVEAGTVCNITRSETGTWSFVNGKLYSNGIENIVSIISCNKCVREFTNSYAQTLRYTITRLL
jgi:hypothetical protein